MVSCRQKVPHIMSYDGVYATIDSGFENHLIVWVTELRTMLIEDPGSFDIEGQLDKKLFDFP